MEEIFKKLTQYIKESSNVVIMTHKHPDLDGLGSAICLWDIVCSFKKECFVVASQDEQNYSIKKMYEILTETKIDLPFTTAPDILPSIEENTLLIVLDVNKIELVEEKQLLKDIKQQIVIDHHKKGSDYIKSATVSYVNTNMSSIVEFMTYYLRYLNKKVSSVIATILLTGLEIDTNNFNLKTTDKTYEAAALLSKLGADPVLKQNLLKENKEEYIRRMNFVKNSDMINKNMAMCILDEKIYTKQDLAIISEQILQFDDVEASFTIGKIDKSIVGISARSIGTVDVEQIMRALGGGGHTTDAACQIADATISEVRKKVLKIVNTETK